MNLHSFGHRHGVAAAPHRDTAAAGRQIFAEGGNALEAMIAMAASIAAVYPHMNHIGGDGFWLVRERSGRVRAFMGAGPAGAGASIARYAEQGLAEIPARGPLAALTVPTLVIHGLDDTLIDPSGGRRTAELVPGAKLMLVEDMGHDRPEPLWPLLCDAILEHTAGTST